MRAATPGGPAAAGAPYRCVAGRLVRLRFRERGGRRRVRESTVVYPALWTRGSVLASARRAHPDTTVRLVEWHPYSADGSWEPTVWIVDPRKVLDYGRTGAEPGPAAKRKRAQGLPVGPDS